MVYYQATKIFFEPTTIPSLFIHGVQSDWNTRYIRSRSRRHEKNRMGKEGRQTNSLATL